MRQLVIEIRNRTRRTCGSGAAASILAAVVVMMAAGAVSASGFGMIDTWAGNGVAGFDGDGNDLLSSSFYFPQDLTFTGSGTYIVDWNNHRIRRVTAQNTLETVVGNNLLGDGDPNLLDRNPPGAPGTDVSLNHTTHVTELANGLIVLSCWRNYKLRQYDPATGLVFVTVGEQPGFSGDGGPARDAQLDLPTQTALAADGSLYILDQRNQRVRMIDAAGIIHTVVGTGVAGYSGDGGPPIDAQINMPSGANPPPAGALAIDEQGRLYISDYLNHRIRQVDFAANMIETFAGNGTPGFGGDGGPATDASLNSPRDIAFGIDGWLYIADERNHRIRGIDPATGIISTVAGNGTAGFSGDGGPATAASLNRPAGLAFDDVGNLYVADVFNHRIRIVEALPLATEPATWGNIKSRFKQPKTP